MFSFAAGCGKPECRDLSYKATPHAMIEALSKMPLTASASGIWTKLPASRERRHSRETGSLEAFAQAVLDDESYLPVGCTAVTSWNSHVIWTKSHPHKSEVVCNVKPQTVHGFDCSLWSQRVLMWWHNMYIVSFSEEKKGISFGEKKPQAWGWCFTNSSSFSSFLSWWCLLENPLWRNSQLLHIRYDITFIG